MKNRVGNRCDVDAIQPLLCVHYVHTFGLILEEVEGKGLSAGHSVLPSSSLWKMGLKWLLFSHWPTSPTIPNTRLTLVRDS